MNINPLKFLLALLTAMAIAACSSDQPAEDEPVDEALTQQLQESFDQQFALINEEITEAREVENEEILENLAELDRETLIDENIDQSDDDLAEDTDKIIKAIEAAID